MIMMFWYDHDMGWWGYAGMGIGMVLFWALLIAGIVALVVFVTGDRPTRRGSSPEARSAEEILAARFARGEISDTEYRDRIAVLRDHARR
jgi:putative membrane protein